MVTMRDDAEWLQQKFGHYDWFHSVGQDSYGYAVLYVRYMNSDTIQLTSTLERDFKVHFVSAALAERTQYTTVLPSRVPGEMPSEPEPVNVRRELFALSRICGRDNLVDIFYEVHDGTNAVSSLSEQYPEARQGMQVLYDAVGFDILFEELDAEY